MSVNGDFLIITAGIRVDEGRNPIELASRDFRVDRMARYVLLGEGEDQGIGDKYDYHELESQIGEEYYLQPAEVSTALELCEDRLQRNSNGWR